MSEKEKKADDSGEVKSQKSPLNAVVIILLALVILLAAGFGYLLFTGDTLPGSLLSGGEFDHDIFTVSMDRLVLKPDDLPASYDISPGGNLRMDNSQFNNNYGSAYGKPFILNTGRVDGWDLSMDRSNPNDFTPEIVRSRVEYYEDADGASKALSKDWFWAYQLEDRMPDDFLDKNCNVGSDCLTYMYKEAKAGGGAIVERYDVAYRYKNIVVWLFIKGQQGEVSEDIALEYAQIILDKIKMLEG